MYFKKLPLLLVRKQRTNFLLFLQSEFKSVTFPQNGTVFDYYVDNQQQEFAPWIQLVPKFELDPDLPLQAVLVHTSGTFTFTSYTN